MTPTQQLRARVATYRDPEARALIHFLLRDDAQGISLRLNLTPVEADENVASRALDFLAEAEAKLPATSP